jgi:hypothetical protein
MLIAMENYDIKNIKLQNKIYEKNNFTCLGG